MRRADRADVRVVRTANLPALDNAAEYAALFADATEPPRRARATAAAARQTTDPPDYGPPLLTAGDRVEVLWGDRYFAGTFTSSRRGTNSNDQPARLHRILYDAVDGWAAEGDWHDLDLEDWRRI